MKGVLAAALMAVCSTSVVWSADISANEEILRLVKAKIPESIILKKIEELRPNLDTSTDAVISLSEAGATEAVLTAFMDAPTVVVQQAREEKFRYNSVSLVSFAALTDEYRVTLKLSNDGDLNHEFLSGTSQSPRPLPNSCEQAILYDDRGQSFPCLSASLPLDPEGPGNARGIEVAPKDSILVTYAFAREAEPAGAVPRRFTFSARPLVLFKHNQGFLPMGTQTFAELAVEFSGISPQ